MPPCHSTISLVAVARDLKDSSSTTFIALLSCCKGLCASSSGRYAMPLDVDWLDKSFVVVAGF